jgi:hypothetical protein
MKGNTRMKMNIGTAAMIVAIGLTLAEDTVHGTTKNVNLAIKMKEVPKKGE